MNCPTCHQNVSGMRERLMRTAAIPRPSSKELPMPTDPAPEKVAALAAALGKHMGIATLALTRLNAAGYDVARIEEGERPRAALERLELVGSTLARITADGDAVTPHPRTWHEFDAALEQARAALAASDEAARHA